MKSFASEVYCRIVVYEKPTAILAWLLGGEAFRELLYDPPWEVYFEERLRVKMTHDLKGRRQLLSLWKQQEGLCPVCHQKITQLTGWHNHHVVWRTHGGSDTADNRVLLHPNCHRQVHSQGLDVARPRATPSVRKA